MGSLHYLPTPVTAERIRRSLHTKDILEARRRRDAIFNDIRLAA